MAADVVPSEELRAFVLRLYRTLEALDVDALQEMLSPSAHMLLIGTDSEEWLRGTDASAIYAQQLHEMAGFRVEAGDISAYCCGNVGWIADRPHLTLANGIEVSPRLTAVLVIDRGHWRVVQWHVSIGQSNEAALGYELTTSIDRVEQTVRVDRPDVHAVSAPDGTVTIMFSDIESSTVLLERLGDTEWLRLLGWHDGIVRHAADEHRGFVVKSQGDGFMIAFPSAAFALRCALAIRERLESGYDGTYVRVRVGLHAGEAIRHADDFYGRTVVIAARIGALALGAEILTSDLVRELARGLGTFNFGESRTAILKGLEGEFRLYPVLN